MIHVLHLLDRDAGWEQRVALSQLLDRLPQDRFSQSVATLDVRAAQVVAGFPQYIHRIHGVPGLAGLGLPGLAKLVRTRSVDVVHAWGCQAAAHGATLQKPTVLELFDPVLASRHARWLRSIARSDRLTVVCSAEWVRRRLIEGGVPPGACVLVRPGVDFGLIRQWKRRPLRDELGMGKEWYLILVSEPVSKSSGAWDVAWSCALLHHLEGRVGMILPGRSSEQERIARFISRLPTENAIVRTFDRYRFEELIPHADVLVLAADGDTSTTAIAWAMASQTAVIGSAVHCIAELIANKVGGLLFKREVRASDAPAIVRLLQDRPAHKKAVEVAYGHAYEAFGLRRYIDDHVNIYQNVLAGTPPAVGMAAC